MADSDQQKLQERRARIVRLIYGSEGAAQSGGQRFTQDSPVMPEVWLTYAFPPEGERPGGPLDLLINPFMGQRAGLVARELREVTQRHRQKQDLESAPAPVAHLPGLVATSLTFEELMRVALPSTLWWERCMKATMRRLGLAERPLSPEAIAAQDAARIGALVDYGPIEQGDFETDRRLREFLWLIRLGSHVDAAIKSEEPPRDGEEMVRRFCAIYNDWTEGPTPSLIWNIALNRKASLSGHDSTLSVKADAGRRLFNISCSQITWAIIDSGIDVSSPAFRDWSQPPPPSEPSPGDSPDSEILRCLYRDSPRRVYSKDSDSRSVLRPPPGKPAPRDQGWPTRILERYDFTDLTRLLDLAVTRAMALRLREILRKTARDPKELGAPNEERFWDLTRESAMLERVGLRRAKEAMGLFKETMGEDEAWRIARVGGRLPDPQAKAPPPPPEDRARVLNDLVCFPRTSPDDSIWPLLRRLRACAPPETLIDEDQDEQDDEPPRRETSLKRLQALSLPGWAGSARFETPAEWMRRVLTRIIETACVKIGHVERREIVREMLIAHFAANPKDARACQASPSAYEKLLAKPEIKTKIAEAPESFQEMARWSLFRRGVERAEKQIRSLIDRIDLGLELDWSTLEELLIDTTPDRPSLAHGTQVAGVLAADWREPPPGGAEGEAPPDHMLIKMQGVCPDIRLIDLRVSDSAGRTQEFEAISALQFVLHLNARSTEKILHGVNISLSIEHDIRSYGCGKTRICEACEQVVASGVVVVAAAGNGGATYYDSLGGAQFQGYQLGSITDPGNAESVITVGSTHAMKPHQYGVSYFSSRGPTGDGRMKPDLVAPGEKIVTSGLGGSISVVDGTSFAAPHVSGAAALLMARHSEMIGQPQAVKEALKSTATDLGRDRHFQGAGMLDVLRALQSL